MLVENTDHAELLQYERVPSVQGARILLIEDDEVLREVIERNLSVRHHEVSIAADAESALRHLRSSTFDLIILDINLPDLSGWDVLRIAKREMQYSMTKREKGNLPVIVVSAVRVSPRRLSEFHPLAYLPKPFPMEALLRLAVEAAERRRGVYSQQEYDSDGDSDRLPGSAQGTLTPRNA